MIELTRKQFGLAVKIYHLLMMMCLFGTIFVLGAAQNKLIEAVLSLAGFLSLKELYYYKMHSSSMAMCFVYSTAVFACLTRLCIPVQSSLLCAPILGMLTAYVAANMSKAGAVMSEAASVLEAHVRPFDCRTSTAEEIKKKARQVKLSDEQASWVISKYINGKTYKELSRPMESEKACQMRIKRVITKLNQLD